MILVALLLIAQDTSDFVGEIRERLDKPVNESFVTTKPVIDLELCVANALSWLGTPTLLRDGSDKVHMMISYPGRDAYLASASFIKISSGTRIDFRVRGKARDDRLASRVKACL